MYKITKKSDAINSTSTTFRLDIECRNKLKYLATKGNTTLSNVVRQLINDTHNTMEHSVKNNDIEQMNRHKNDQIFEDILAKLTAINNKLKLKLTTINEQFNELLVRNRNVKSAETADLTLTNKDVNNQKYHLDNTCTTPKDLYIARANDDMGHKIAQQINNKCDSVLDKIIDEYLRLTTIKYHQETDDEVSNTVVAKNVKKPKQSKDRYFFQDVSIDKNAQVPTLKIERRTQWQSIKDLPSADFNSLIGVEYATFMAMVDVLQVAYYKKKTSKGRPLKLCLEDMLLMTLERLIGHKTYSDISQNYDLTKDSIYKKIKWVESLLVENKIVKFIKSDTVSTNDTESETI